MNKVFCSPITKFILFLAGYVPVVSALRAMSHTFDVLLGNFFGTWLRFGLFPSVLFFALCFGLLLLSVALTKRPPKEEMIFRIWRELDFSLLVIFTLSVVLYLLPTAFVNWAEGSSFFLLILAYMITVFTITELVARLRDRDLLRTLYWVRFFRLHPIWRPLGFLFALLLLGNLLILFVQIITFVLMPAFSMPYDMMRFSGRAPFSLALFFFRFTETATGSAGFSLDITNLLFYFSVITLIALTYFVAAQLNLSKRYDEANEEKIQAERFKSELITNVSHDIRTPLTSIINYVGILKNQPLDGISAEYVTVLDKKSARLKTLIEDLMEASKAGTGNVRVMLEKVNLSELVGQVAGEFDDQFAEQGLTLVLREPDDPVFAYVDSRHLWRTLENLFSNTAKYALPGTRVFAEISLQEDTPVFSLKNTSASPIDLSGDVLTEQFIRGDRARDSEGSGLGLYIAKSLVELMGGEFTIRTSGDLFEVEILFA